MVVHPLHNILYVYNIHRWVHTSEGKVCSVPFTKFYFIPFVYSLKMPSDEGIKIWVGISCDKGTPPINLHIFTIPNSTAFVANKQHTRGGGTERNTDRVTDRQSSQHYSDCDLHSKWLEVRYSLRGEILQPMISVGKPIVTEWLECQNIHAHKIVLVKIFLWKVFIHLLCIE